MKECDWIVCSKAAIEVEVEVVVVIVEGVEEVKVATTLTLEYFQGRPALPVLLLVSSNRGEQGCSVSEQILIGMVV